MERRLVRDLSLTDLPLTSHEPVAVYARRALFFLKGILTVAALCLGVAVLILFAQASSSWVPWIWILATLVCVGIGVVLLGTALTKRMRIERFLLTIAGWLLPPSERDRYVEEIYVELLDLPRYSRVRYALSLLRGIVLLRLHRRAKSKAADAEVRKAED